MQKEPNYLTDNKIRIFTARARNCSPQPGELVLRRGDPLHVPAGSGRRPELDGLRAHQHPEPARRLHARHALQGHLRRRFPLRLLGLRARPERARLHPVAPQGHARLEPRPDRRDLRGGLSASTPGSPSRSASTGPTSPPGRPRTASSSSATTSTTATASGTRSRWRAACRRSRTKRCSCRIEGCEALSFPPTRNGRLRRPLLLRVQAVFHTIDRRADLGSSVDAPSIRRLIDNPIAG